MRMTLDSICKVGFGVEIGSLAPNLPENKFAKAFDTANMIVTLRFIDPLWKIKRFLNLGSEALLDKSIKTIDDFTYSVIATRKKEIQEAQTTHTDPNKVIYRNTLYFIAPFILLTSFFVYFNILTLENFAKLKILLSVSPFINSIH